MTEFAAKGTTLGIEIGTGGTFTVVSQVRNISGPSLALDPIDVSTHDDAAKFYRDFLPGFHDPGEVTLELIWDPSSGTQGPGGEGLLELYDSAVEHGFQITWPNAAADTWEFQGLVTAYEPAAPFDDALTASVTIKLVGAPTFV